MATARSSQTVPSHTPCQYSRLVIPVRAWAFGSGCAGTKRSSAAPSARRRDVLERIGVASATLRLAPKIVMLRHPRIDLMIDPKDFMGSVKRNVETLGRIFDKQAKANWPSSRHP